MGNHSHYHARMPLLNVRGLRSDIAAAEGAIIEATVDEVDFEAGRTRLVKYLSASQS